MQKENSRKTFTLYCFSPKSSSQLIWSWLWQKSKPLLGIRNSVFPLEYSCLFFNFILFLAYGEQKVGRHILHWQPSCNQLDRRGEGYRNQIVPRKEDCDYILFYLESLYFSNTYKTNNNNDIPLCFMITSSCDLQATFCLCLKIEFPFLGGKACPF